MLLKDIQGWLSTYFRRKGCAQHIWHWSTEQGQILRREVLYMWWKWKLCEKFISLELSPLGSLSHWLVSWASMGIDPHEVCWAMASGLTGPGNLEQLPLVLVLVFDHRTPGTFQISINWGAFVKSYSWFLLSLSLSLPLPPFPPLCLFPSSEGWHFFWKVLFFYDLSPFLPKFIQCVFWLFHLPLRASWRSECSEAFLFLRHLV